MRNKVSVRRRKPGEILEGRWRRYGASTFPSKCRIKVVGIVYDDRIFDTYIVMSDEELANQKTLSQVKALIEIKKTAAEQFLRDHIQQCLNSIKQNKEEK